MAAAACAPGDHPKSDMRSVRSGPRPGAAATHASRRHARSRSPGRRDGAVDHSENVSRRVPVRARRQLAKARPLRTFNRLNESCLRCIDPSVVRDCDSTAQVSSRPRWRHLWFANRNDSVIPHQFALEPTSPYRLSIERQPHYPEAFRLKD